MATNQLKAEDKSKEEALAIIKHNRSAALETDELIERYDTWADQYDKDIGTCYNHTSQKLIAKATYEVLGTKKDAVLLDCAAGTGLVGEQLHSLGFPHLDAIDASEGMLLKAKKRGIYRRVICDLLGKNRLDIVDGTYDALVMNGGILPNHVTGDCFEELIRITKSGGYILIMMMEVDLLDPNTFKDPLEKKMQRLHDSGCWSWLKRKIYPANSDNEAARVLFCFQVV